MPTKILTGFFTNFGDPQTAIDPTISIYMLDAVTPLQVVTDAAMKAVGGGWFQYYFESWDHTKRFVFTCDGTATITMEDERYLFGAIRGTAEEGVLINAPFDGIKIVSRA